MTKIDKIDIENINFIKKELKLQNVRTVKIKKGNYEIYQQLQTNNNCPTEGFDEVNSKYLKCVLFNVYKCIYNIYVYIYIYIYIYIVDGLKINLG